MLIDTHSHLNFNAFKDDADKVIEKCLDQNVWMINVGSQYSDSRKAVEISRKYPQGVYAAIGLHPLYAEEDFDYSRYGELAENEKVVAIGEIGLDYYYKPKTKIKLEPFKARQKEVFLKQISLAGELGLPVIFHCRMAHSDMIEILKQDKCRGVIHCFTGNWSDAEQYLEMGFYLGFNGIIFKLDLDDIIKKTPLERILIETDCPYLTPPVLGTKRNEPVNVKYVAERIAELKNLSFQDIEEATTKNAKELFKL